MCHVFFPRRRHSHHRRVENASSYEPTWCCGIALNVGLETQKMFVLKAKQSFLAMLWCFISTSPRYMYNLESRPWNFLNCVIKTERECKTLNNAQYDLYMVTQTICFSCSPFCDWLSKTKYFRPRAFLAEKQLSFTNNLAWFITQFAKFTVNLKYINYQNSPHVK